MKKQLTIHAKTAILPDSDTPKAAHVQIKGDVITGIGESAETEAPDNAENSETLNCGKYVLAPGIVDLGVFAIDKPAFHFGGITRAALMPDQNPPLNHPARVRFAALSGKPDFWVHPMGAATLALNGMEMAEMGLMQMAGAKAIATGRKWISDSGVMLRIMQYCAMLDLPLIIHAEDMGIKGESVATAGALATILGLPQAPAEAESIAIMRDIELARLSGAKVHFRQVTTKKGFDLIRQAKNDGLAVTCGITPAHLLLNEHALMDYRSFARLSPPLRSEDDRLAALDALKDGTIDVMASGHDPRDPEDKRLPFADAEPGMAGAETLLALGLGLVHDGTITIGRLFDLISRNPAQILGVKAGQIAPEYDADLLLIDTEKPWQVDLDEMAASAGNTPFDKLPVQGRAMTVIKGGQIIAESK